MGILTPELERERKRIKALAENVGLDFFDTIFELVTHTQLNEIAACGGFLFATPIGDGEWSTNVFQKAMSMAYQKFMNWSSTMILAMPILWREMSFSIKIGYGSRYGHSDFFKNNKWFEPTNRKMLDTTANHATRVRRYQEIYGVDVVEDFIDKCLSVENLIDRYRPYTKVKSTT